MSLADHYDGKYFSEGRFVAMVTGHKIVNFNSGNTGVEFQLRGENGQTGKTDAFALVEKALWKLASFARACGLSKEQCRTYDPFNPACHSVLHNRKVGIVVEKGEKYHEVVDFFPPELPGKAQSQAPTETRTVTKMIDEQPPAEALEAAATGAGVDKEEIPF